MDIILNQVAIWRPCGAKRLSMRPSPIGTQYRNPDGVVYKQSTKPLLRYAKDYTVKKVKFSLFLRTFCEDASVVEAALDVFAKEISKEYALKATANADFASFEYTPFTFNTKEIVVKGSE